MSNSSNHGLYTVQNHENTNKKAFFFVFSRLLPQNPSRTPGNPFLGWRRVWVTTEMAHRRKNNNEQDKTKKLAFLLSNRFYSPPRTQNVNTTLNQKKYFLFFFLPHALGFCVSLTFIKKLYRSFPSFSSLLSLSLCLPRTPARRRSSLRLCET